MPMGRAFRHRRIILAIFLPVLAVGLGIGILANQLLAPPLLAHLQSSTDGQLKMASGMGLAICDNLLDQILSRRLEDSQDELAAMKREALAEISELASQFPTLAVVVVDHSGAVLASSLGQDLNLPQLELGPLSDNILTLTVQGRALRLHRAYFPFWRWNIISLITEESYLAPSRMAAQRVYLGIFGVLLSVLLALLAVFHWLVNRPLARIIDATREISQGRFAKVPLTRHDELGQVAGAFNTMVGSLEDGRRQMDAVMARLRESKDQYRMLTENAMALITIVQDGRFVFANRMMLEKTGYSQERIIGAVAWDLVHPEDRELVGREGRAGGEAPQQESHYEFRFITASGQERWLEMQATRIQYKGRPAILGHGIDISARKEAQAEQSRLQQRLEHAQRMEVVGTLAGGISHDFNNMLQAVSGYAQLMLMRSGPDGPQDKYLQGILRACQRSSELVNQLLTFSRRSHPKTRRVDLNQEVGQVARMLERTIPRMISIETSLTQDLKPIQADPTQIEQVLMNLGNNAKDAMPQGGRLLFETCNIYLDEQYSARQVGVAPGHYVLLKVSDNGLGMSKEVLSRIFEPFYTTKGLGEGTGLGLSTVYGIVKAHQGHITCYSQPGQGTIFKLYLPAEEHGALGEEPAPQELIHLPGGHEMVLLVDDEPALLEVAREMLQQFGYQVLTAGSGEEAPEVLGRRDPPIDLVIMDLGMPGMGGRACLDQVLKLAPGLPVIISTGYSTNGQERELLQAGAAAFLAKPYQMVELLVKVRQALDTPSLS
ncbi:MAG: PAS domain S-box protein [Pseudomonadota bacterium]